MSRRVTPGYAAALTGTLLLAIVASWTSLASRMDRDAYDWMSRADPPVSRKPQSVVLAIDEQTLRTYGGMRALRTTLADTLELLIPVRPAAVAVDVILADAQEPAVDARLAAVLRKLPLVVLASDLLPDTATWENPLDIFRRSVPAVGHIHAAPDPVSRVLPLELTAGHDRRWAMALEAARLRLGPITESPEDLELGSIRIPATRDSQRAMFIRYRDGIPVVGAADLRQNPTVREQFRDKVVFVGVTAQTAARDRLMTPLDRSMSGVEIHAQAFETIVGQDFLRPAPLSLTVAICFCFVVAAGAIFATLSGWQAFVPGAVLILLAHVMPHVLFANGLVVSYLATIWAAWLSVVAAAAWQYFIVRRRLLRSEADRQRYQEAIQFVTHEMRSPLTAIQGSSELMGRYNLSEEKRRQMVQMIHSESRRLGRMIQTFLDIERLTDGQTEFRTEPYGLRDVLQTCVDRAMVLAERKNISLVGEETGEYTLNGDRELMEYAVYNLLTNAVKYSPENTVVTISTARDGSEVRLTVADQGMGMDEKELRNLGRRFYRTKKAEASGEPGTGIGLSLVQQIVTHHQGRMEISSRPGAGSRFTMVLPISPPVATLSR